MDKYLIVLQGQGDFYAFFIDEDTYEWATTEDITPPQAIIDAYIQLETDIALRYGNGAPPPNELEALKELKGSSGSWDNDRMLMMSNLSGTQIYYSFMEASKAASALGYTIINEYHGYIY